MKISKQLQERIIRSVFDESVDTTSTENDEIPLYLEEDTGEYILIKSDGKVIKRKSKTKIRDLCRSFGLTPPDVFTPIRLVYDPQKETGIQDDTEGKIYNSYEKSKYQEKHQNSQASIPTNSFPIIDKLLSNLFTEKSTKDAFINWLAVIFNTSNKTQTAWVLVGPQGSGKNTLYNDVIKPLLGRNNCRLVNQDTLESRFNKLLKERLLVCFNEVSASKKGQDRLKTWITEEEMIVEGKGRDSISQNNPANFLFISNNNIPVIIEKDDRRFSVVKTGGALRKYSWFKGDTTIKLIQDELDIFAAYLGSYTYNIQQARTPVETEYKNAVAKFHKDKFEEFSEHIISDDQEWVLSHISDKAYDEDELSKLSNFSGSLEKELTLKVFNDIYDATLTKTKLTQILKLHGIEEDRGKQKNGTRKRRYIWYSRNT